MRKMEEKTGFGATQKTAFDEEIYKFLKVEIELKSGVELPSGATVLIGLWKSGSAIAKSLPKTSNFPKGKIFFKDGIKLADVYIIPKEDKLYAESETDSIIVSFVNEQIVHFEKIAKSIFDFFSNLAKRVVLIESAHVKLAEYLGLRLDEAQRVKLEGDQEVVLRDVSGSNLPGAALFRLFGAVEGIAAEYYLHLLAEPCVFVKNLKVVLGALGGVNVELATDSKLKRSLRVLNQAQNSVFI